MGNHSHEFHFVAPFFFFTCPEFIKFCQQPDPNEGFTQVTHKSKSEMSILVSEKQDK